MMQTLPRKPVARLTMAVAISIGTTNPVFAQGSNTTSPAPAPATPAPVVTSLPQLATVGAGGCAQQYTNAINALNAQVLTSNDVGLAANAVGAAADVTSLVAQEVAASASAVEFGLMSGFLAADIPAVGTATPAAAPAAALATTSTAEAIALGAAIVGAGSTVTGVASQIAAQTFAHNAQDLTVYVATLPDCEVTHTGTVTVTDGGVNVSGRSIFNDNVGIAADANVQGNVTASQVQTTQGISAMGGGIVIGDPNGTTYSDGITIGGGAVSGAGFGGAQAFTGDANAIAIGNNAQAQQSGSVAVGLDASASGADATAVGTGATASADDSTAVGSGAQATAAGSSAYGQGAVATLTQQQVFGTAGNTYTMPGITSTLSRQRQSGPLEVVNTDAAGNLATDGGEIYRTLSENQAGIAIAMALPTPSLQLDERFGLAVNWGRYRHSQAIGVSALGVINDNVFGGGERLSLNGAIGLSKNEKSFGGHSSGTAHGGRVGFQLTW